MTLSELGQAVKELLEQGVAPDEPVCADVNAVTGELTDVAIIVTGDRWVPGTVVLLIDLFDDGEADDG